MKLLDAFVIHTLATLREFRAEQMKLYDHRSLDIIMKCNKKIVQAAVLVVLSMRKAVELSLRGEVSSPCAEKSHSQRCRSLPCLESPLVASATRLQSHSSCAQMLLSRHLQH